MPAQTAMSGGHARELDRCGRWRRRRLAGSRDVADDLGGRVEVPHDRAGRLPARAGAATAAPMPDAPPVTTATRSLSSIVSPSFVQRDWRISAGPTGPQGVDHLGAGQPVGERRRDLPALGHRVADDVRPPARAPRRAGRRCGPRARSPPWSRRSARTTMRWSLVTSIVPSEPHTTTWVGRLAAAANDVSMPTVAPPSTVIHAVNASSASHGASRRRGRAARR